MGVQVRQAMAGLAISLLSAPAMADWTMNMTPGVTAVSNEIFNLHMTILWICVVIGVIVFAVMFWSIFAHRKSRGAKPANFHENTTVEILWTVVPILILVGMAIPATSTLVKMYDTEASDLDIMITGYQWRWRYDYIGEDYGFFSSMSTSWDEIYNRTEKGENYLLEVDNPLVIPAGKKVRFLMTANDVIHSWWVPAFAVKKDTIPGFINEAWTRVDKPGIYRGQCAELCGKDHAFMPIVVKVVPPDEYNDWLEAQKEAAARERELTSKDWSLAELVERGQRVYAAQCVACHGAEGRGNPPIFPALRGNERMLGDLQWHLGVLVNGVRGTAMQAYGDQLSEVDLAAVVTFTRNALGNNQGDMVTPLEVRDFKNAQQ
ncbi:MAG: cytochrome c oxidase subunit II [Marinobacter sp.]|nr:cytochrome c oxidase subunit II [Marinobacter sp.]